LLKTDPGEFLFNFLADKVIEIVETYVESFPQCIKSIS